ncbi:hypothetical protein [Leptospira weilii]|uniref:Uncharacterized protein n=2 Tax=Leptospira weilii TaxID=28184 RepID=M6QR09_9LEPT|nr:hypothetical protein [Leptospira weilii]EMN91267.1 hypothetical protein LEP1GSC108_3312 [Leptospira weilii str. UI 13098]ULH27452.1 hypothetical protein FH586_13620 [Leptospira weilii]UPY77556.1 hypothetical protein FH581_001465 [Leptospira weilii]
MKKKKLKIVGFIPNEDLVFNESLKIDAYNSEEVSQYITSLITGKEIQRIEILEGNLDSLIIGIPVKLQITFADGSFMQIENYFENKSIWSRMAISLHFSKGDMLSEKSKTFYRKKIPFYQRMIVILKDKFDF